MDRQARWDRYNALPDKSEGQLDAVCGELSGVTCTTIAGRPSDAETNSCDIYCCRRGFRTGHCNPRAVIGTLAMRQNKAPLDPFFMKRFECTCTNDERDATCGPDGSFIGIRCPVDWSACRRKCCREGRSGGHCGGFLRLKCKCD